MVVFHIDIINAIAQARNIRHLLASDILDRWQQGEEATPDQAQSLIQLGNWIDFLTDSEQLVVDGCIDSTDVWNIIQQIGEQAIGLDCVGTNYSYNNPPPVPNVNILNYVQSVNGLNTNNTDPQNPIVRISVDGSTITGNGTPASPLVAVVPVGGVQSVTGNLVNNADPENPIVNSPLTPDELAAIQGANAPDGTNVFATLADITGGSQDLAQVLAVGNTSGANDIEFDVTQGLLFSNTSRLREGTIDAGLGGQKGIAEICGLGFESKWEAGRRYIMGSSGSTIRQSLYNFNIPPTTSDDASLGYQDGSLWTLDDGTTYECIDAASGNWQLRSNALIIYITVGDLQNLEVLGTLNINALYIVTDAFPYKLMCKAESGGVLSRTAEIIDSTLSGQVLYDLQGDTWLNGAIYDGLGNTWNGTLPTSAITLGAGCAGNTFNQGVRNIQLGADSSGNIFEYLSGSGGSITCGDSAVNNTFKQGTEGFTFGDGLQNVIIEAGVFGDDYSALPDYDFLYNKTYSSTIFQSGGINYHRYFDIANDRIVVTDLATPANITYIGGGGATPDLQQVTTAGATTSVGITVDNGAGESIQIKHDLIKITNALGEATITSPTLTTSTEFQLPDKLTSPQTFAMLSDLTSGGITKATAAGVDTYTATVSGVASYTDGDAYLIRFTNGNTTGATLNINSLGAKSLYRNNDGAIIGGDIWDGGEMLCVFNTTLDAFQCIGTSPNSIFAYITNDESVTTITKGQVVYAFGGVGDRMTVKLADNTTDATSARTVGVVLSTSIAAGQKGIIILQGLLDGLSTLKPSVGSWADGDIVYLSNTAGGITRTKQYAPNHMVYIGTVTTASNGTSGRMYVKIQNGYELDELHNVQAQSPSLKDTLWYDNTVSPAQWKTASISTILGFTPKAQISSVGNGTAVTGVVVNTYSKGLLIPANSRTANDVPQIDCQVRKTGTAGNVQLRFYWNTTNDLAGSPILIGTGINGAANWVSMSRVMSIEATSGDTKVPPNTVVLSTGWGSATAAPNTLAINWGVDGYLICAILNANAADSSVCYMLKLN